MRDAGLIKGNGGNVSMRVAGAGPDGADAFLVTPTAMSYDTMVPSDVVLVDAEGNTLNGSRRPTSDMTAVLYIFRNMPQVNVVIHTHQPYATALGLVVDELPADFTTVIDELVAEGKEYNHCVCIGPMIMMKFCCLTTAKYNIPTIVSMNPIMVDGTGMCGACRLTVGDEVKFACVDGPEFDGHKINWAECMKRAAMYRTEEGEAKTRYLEGKTHEGGCGNC